MEKKQLKNLGFAKVGESGSDEEKKEKGWNEKGEGVDQKQMPIAETKTHISYLGVALEKANKSDQRFVPRREKYSDYINDEFALNLQKKIAVSWLNNDPTLIEGGTSIGKTTTVRKMCAELGYEVHYLNLNGATDVEELMGRYIPNPKKKSDNDPEYIFADGKITSGLRQNEGAKKVIVLDEVNSAKPNVLIRLHEVIDALERNGEISLSEDASEMISVDKEKTLIVGLMNPSGGGYLEREPLDPAQLRRWVYQKEVTELPVKTFDFGVDAMFQLAPEIESQIPADSFLYSRDQRLMREQLSEIPGMKEILQLYKEFHKTAKELVKNRSVAADQPQRFTFDDREEPRRVMNFILRFFNGDISETMQLALKYYYAGKIEPDNEDDQAKMDVLIQNVKYVPKESSKRRKVSDVVVPAVGEDQESSGKEQVASEEGTEEMKEKERLEKERVLKEIEEIREKIGKIEKLPEEFMGEKKKVKESTETLANFEKAREHWMSFYKKYDIDASSLRNIELTDEGMEVQREMAEKYGFDKMLMIPKGISPKELVENKDFLIFKGSDEENQNSKESKPIYVNDDVKASELWNEKTTKPQVIFLKDKKNVDSEEDETMKKLEEETTRDCTYPKIVEMEKELGLEGLDIVDAMILDREYFDETGHHLWDYNDDNGVWLTKTKDQVKSGHSLGLFWSPDFRQWYVSLDDETYCHGSLGSVFSRGLETQQR